jgi:hypothetical protein
MNAVVFEHVPVAELPLAWRERLGDAAGTMVTVRIEQEAGSVAADGFVDDDPAFGIWRDREDFVDMADHMRSIRKPRYNPDGTRNEP